MIDRQLRYELRSESRVIAQSDLLGFEDPLVILGEPGMGKSTLAHWLGSQNGFVLTSARKLIAHPNPSAMLTENSKLVIDALDEVSTVGQNEAVDSVLAALGRAGYPNFILTCRTADWRSRTATEAIKDHYGSQPIEFELLKLEQQEAHQLIAEHIGEAQASVAIATFADHSVELLLGNPQTALMIASVENAGEGAASLGGLFEKFVDEARKERSELRPDAELQSVSRDDALDALGAAFASVILTGSEGITLPFKGVENGFIPYAELKELPGAQALETMLKSRLVMPANNGRATYPHRRIGEFLGARWLARQANSPRKRRRLLKQFHEPGIVPSSLRGLHAWLARDDKLAPNVIAIDPLGVIEYGDADDLTAAEARVLLNALENLSKENPHFREWRHYSARGLAHPELIEEIRGKISDHDAPFGFRLLLIEQVGRPELSEAFLTDFQTLIIGDEYYGLKRTVADAILDMDPNYDWTSILQALRAAEDESSLRLAIDIATKTGFRHLDDDALADLLVTYSKADDGTVGVLFGVERQLPDNRLEPILERLAKAAAQDETKYKKTSNSELTDLAYYLLARRCELGQVSPEDFWSWIRHFDASAGYQSETREKISQVLRSDDTLRRAIQKIALFGDENGSDIWARGWKLQNRSLGLVISADDAIALLAALPRPTNEQNLQKWKDLVSLVPRKSEGFGSFLEAVRVEVEHHEELTSWLREIENPPKPEWEIKRERREKQFQEEQDRKRREHREHYAERLDEMRSGEFAALINPAKAYLKMFRDIGDHCLPHERIQEWLGEEIAEAAYLGIERFLTRGDPKPTADEIAKSNAESKHWPAAHIIIVALAERIRLKKGLSDLPDERLLAGLFETWQSQIDSHAGIEGLASALESEAKSRGLWEDAQRRWFEPQFHAKRAYIDGLYRLMRSDEDADLASKLAFEWLNRFPDMPHEPETELVDRLISNRSKEVLRKLTSDRLSGEDLDEERRLNWQAVGIYADFEEASSAIAKDGVNRDLLWALRNRLDGGRWQNAQRTQLGADQLAWIVKTFRSLYPSVNHPTGSTMGDTNPWDASDYIRGAISRLGEIADEAASGALLDAKSSESDGYTNHILYVLAEHRRKIVELTYSPPNLTAVKSLVEDSKPTDVLGLQSVLTEEFHILSTRLAPGGDRADVREGFFEGGKPKSEEACRNYLLVLLEGQLGFDIELRPESNLARKKRVDIEASLGANLMVPIEIKGQWHRELWTAADTQLDRLYASDWRADRRGIYVVLWFGSAGKPVKAPPDREPRPSTGKELAEKLRALSRAARSGLIEIVVLDLSPTLEIK